MYHDGRWGLRAEPFLFARFENAPSECEEVAESRVEVEVLPGGTQQAVKSSTSHPTASAFDNPMYGNTEVRKKSLQTNLTYKEYRVFGCDSSQGTTYCPKLRGYVYIQYYSEDGGIVFLRNFDKFPKLKSKGI
jgi:hypothetical protein